MRGIKLIVLLLLLGVWLYCIPESGISQEYLEKGSYRLIRSTYTSSLIAGMNISGWKEAQKLDGFSLTSGNGAKYMMREYSLYNPSLEGKSFSLDIGFYPTVFEAEKAVLNFLTYPRSISLQAWETPPVGDSAWYEGTSPDKPAAVAFIRKNAVVFLHGHMPDINLLTQAKSIDSAFLDNAPYVVVSDILQPPIIKSVTLSKYVVTPSDKVVMTISAEDPQGLRLNYSTDGYPFFSEANIISFYYQPDPNLVSSKMMNGEHQIKVWAVNENNLFSSVKEVTVTF